MAATPDLGALSNFILQRFAKRGTTALQETTSLVKSGWVDSFGVVEIVAFIESEYGVRLPDSEVAPENFENLATIRALIERCNR